MSVRVEGGRVWLEGCCPAADAEALCAALTGRSGRTVDVSGVSTLHTAVVQALLALRPPIEGAFQGGFLSAHGAAMLTLP